MVLNFSVESSIFYLNEHKHAASIEMYKIPTVCRDTLANALKSSGADLSSTYMVLGNAEEHWYLLVNVLTVECPLWDITKWRSRWGSFAPYLEMLSAPSSGAYAMTGLRHVEVDKPSRFWAMTVIKKEELC